MKCLFLYNPKSGKGKIARKEKYIKSYLGKIFDEVDVFYSNAKGDIFNKILECGQLYHTLVVAGGDGTISEAVNGIMHLNKRPNLAILPFGTVNDVAHSLHIPFNTKKALAVIKNGKPLAHDVLKVNNDFGIYVFGGGVFTETSYNTPQKAKKKFGRLAYGIHGLKEMFRSSNAMLSFTINGQTFSCNASLFLFINSIFVAGFKIDKTNNACDQKASFVLIKSADNKVKVSQLFKIAKLFVCGYKQACSHDVFKIKTSKIVIECEKEYPFNLDGEIYFAKSVTVEVVPGLNILH